jgi:hydroxymethylglutaryl-CoA synthase
MFAFLDIRFICSQQFGTLVLSNTINIVQVGKRVLLYSYGSGLAATTFSVVIRAPVNNIAELADIHTRISKRVTLPPQEFTQVR